MSEPRQSPRVTVSAFGLTDMGMVRTNNEDAFLIAAVYAWMPAGSIAWVNLSN